MEKYILTIIAILGLLLSIKIKGVFHKIISFGLTFSILITWVGGNNIILVSILLFTLLGVVTGIYGLTVKGLGMLERFSISTIGLLLMIETLFKIMHWPMVDVLKLILVIPVICYLASLIINKKVLTKEMSFMIIWTAFAAMDIMIVMDRLIFLR